METQLWEATTSRSEMQPREAINQQPAVIEEIVRSEAIRDRRCQQSSSEQIRDATVRTTSKQIRDATTRTSSQQSPTRSCKAKPSLQPRRANEIYCTSTTTTCCRWLHRLPQPLQLNSPPHSLSPSFHGIDFFLKIILFKKLKTKFYLEIRLIVLLDCF